MWFWRLTAGAVARALQTVGVGPECGKVYEERSVPSVQPAHNCNLRSHTGVAEWYSVLGVYAADAMCRSVETTIAISRTCLSLPAYLPACRRVSVRASVRPVSSSLAREISGKTCCALLRSPRLRQRRQQQAVQSSPSRRWHHQRRPRRARRSCLQSCHGIS